MREHSLSKELLEDRRECSRKTFVCQIDQVFVTEFVIYSVWTLSFIGILYIILGFIVRFFAPQTNKESEREKELKEMIRQRDEWISQNLENKKEPPVRQPDKDNWLLENAIQIENEKRKKNK